MTNLFSKAAIFSDIHLGNKTNSVVHNTDCVGFIDWFIETAKANDCTTCIFLGDYFHNRNNVNLVTLKYGIEGMEKLSKAFEKVYLILGNHDLYFKDSRSISSMAWAPYLPNVVVFEDITEIGNCVFAPWLVHEDYKQLMRYKAPYLFSHLELPSFLMNGQVAMPDVGELHAEDLLNYSNVFTGHFHMRQRRWNITYIGNAFPHNFGDSGDNERGMMVLAWGKEPEFIAWPKAPQYKTVNLSEAIVNPNAELPENSYVKMILDTDISYEEALILKESLVSAHNLRELSLVAIKPDYSSVGAATSLTGGIKTIDQIILEELNTVSSDFYDNTVLLNIFKGL